MKRHKDLITLGIVAVLALVALVLWTLLGAPKDHMADTLVKLVASTNQVDEGEPFQVSVEITPGDGVEVAGAQFNLIFDPEALKINSVQEGNFLNQGGAQTFFLAGTIDNNGGTLKNVAGATKGAGSGVTQPGTFAVIQCTALKGHTSSGFALDNVIVGNQEAAPVPLQPITVDQVDVTISGDLNNDGFIDDEDLVAVGAVFGSSGDPGFIRADVDKDGVITVLDLITVGQKIQLT